MSVCYKFRDLLADRGMTVCTDELANGKKVMSFSANSKNFPRIDVHIIFDSPDETSANIKAVRIAQFPPEKQLMALMMVNKFNYEYRWVTFSTTPEKSIIASTDARYENNDAGLQILYEAILAILNIVDMVYPTIKEMLNV